jgi:hypothetical protein
VTLYQRLVFTALSCAATTSMAAPVLQITAPTEQQAVLTHSTDFIVLADGVGWDITAPIWSVAQPNTLGCFSGDFADFSSGGIALIRRGICPLSIKVDNAFAAGAAGVLIYNNAPGPLYNVSLDDTGLGPVFSISLALGSQLENSMTGPTGYVVRMGEAEDSLAVPEPGSLPLAVLAMATLGLTLRRRA